MLASEYYVWPRLGLAGIGPLFSFGIYRTFEYIVWMIFASADILIISRWLGPVEVGVYVVASNFAAMPLNKIAPIVNATAFPAFALVQERPSEARFYALKAVRMMAAIAVPLFFGLSVTAPEVVDLVFGPNWIAARPVLGVLALAVTFRAILLVVPNFLQGIGDSRASFWCTAVGAVIFPPAFVDRLPLGHRRRRLGLVARLPDHVCGERDDRVPPRRPRHAAAAAGAGATDRGGLSS